MFKESLTISCKVRHVLTKDLAIMLLYIFPREMKWNLCSHKNLYTNVYVSSSLNGPKWELRQVSNRWMLCSILKTSCCSQSQRLTTVWFHVCDILEKRMVGVWDQWLPGLGLGRRCKCRGIAEGFLFGVMGIFSCGSGYIFLCVLKFIKLYSESQLCLMIIV